MSKDMRELIKDLMKEIEELRLENKRLKDDNPKELIQELIKEKKELNRLNEFYAEATGYKYGGYLDINKALDLAEEYGLADEVGYLCKCYEEDEGGDLEKIDPVGIVMQNMVFQVQDSLRRLYVNDIEFEVYADYLDTSVSLDKKAIITLQNCLEFEIDCFDALDDTEKEFIKEAGFDIEAYKKELLQIQALDDANNSQEKSNTKKQRR